MMGDYLDLDAFSYYDEDDVIDLWVVTEGEKTIVCRNATSAVRYNGWWSIGHKIAEFMEATAYIPADSVQYFNLIHHKKRMEDTHD